MPNKENNVFISEGTEVKPKYDFSNVNLATGDGAQLVFDSWEEMEEYMDAYNDARRAAGLL